MRIVASVTALAISALSLGLIACGGDDTTATGGSGSGGDTTGSGATGAGAGPGSGGSGGQACTPETEICDGMDNDCDGDVDEPPCTCENGATQECYSGRAGTKGVGECKAGTQTCAKGVWGACTGEVKPADEECNTKDDDCNGMVDDMGMSTCGVGACQVTVELCTSGVANVCTPGSPALEICDGLDNDCDQQTDESFPNLGAVCDTGLSGVCSPGKKQCIAGTETCVADLMSTDELCDGLDNDCDGTVDNDIPGTGGDCTTGQLGECSFGSISCQNSTIDCFPLSPSVPEVCDGLDNDCDGTDDDGDPGGGAACATGQPGVCGAGTEHCVMGGIQCVPNNLGQTEVCNGLDDDCDGSADEGNPGGGGPCSCGGVLNCVNNALVCQNCTKEFVCNDGIDDDGDGLTDCADPECAFACTLAACGAGQKLITLVSTDVPKAINDNSTVTSVMNVTYSGTVQRAVVKIDNLMHTFDGDVVLSFKGPGTADVDLSSDNGGADDNYINTVFDDLCPTPVTSATGPFTGCFHPEGTLASLNGTPINGTWTLTVGDNATVDVGSLNAWRAAFCVALP